jgi:ABC-type Mn2+/Zn2+ transport system ATPase subunit
MKYSRFVVENFKGIAHAEVRLDGPRIMSIVGLNESGKTTLLEAIHSFRPDKSTQTLVYGGDVKAVSPDYLIPKHKEANFNGEIKVTAEVVLSTSDKRDLVAHMRDAHEVHVEGASIPSTFEITKSHEFKASRHVDTNTYWDIKFYKKTEGSRELVDYDTDEVTWAAATDWIQQRLPVIRYFPTFLFQFPERIVLNDSVIESTNQIYRRMFASVLKHTDPTLDIDEHIVKRVTGGSSGPFVGVMQVYFDSVDRRHVDAVLAKVSALVTAVVIKRWNEIFRDKIMSKVVSIEPSITKAEGSEEASVGVRFLIEDGTEKYNVSERSLGFRWFFCFLLFTQFQTSRGDGRSTIFIFDEPASNLHARAQRQLLESFVHIARGDNALIYSTHSHHMINPAWLEGAYIVENQAVTYTESDFVVPWKNTKTQINLYPYKQFVSRFPKKTTYFEPILEALDYAPSDLEFVEPAVLVEGKSDFYVFTYFSKVLGLSKLDFMPSSGADDLGPITALYLGWGKNFILLLDGDKKGKESKERYVEEFSLPAARCMTTADVDPLFKTMESALGPDVSAMVAAHYGTTGLASKKQIMRFFQEHLATKTKVNVPESAVTNVKRLIEEFERRLAG